MDEVSPVAVTRYEEGRCLGGRDDVLASEEPLEIRVEGHSIAIVMRTPGADRELAAGFLLSEGIVKSAKEIFDITTCVVPGDSGNAVDVGLANPRAFDPEKFTRHVFTSSSCGLCGKTSIAAVLKRRRPLKNLLTVPASVLFALPPRLLQAQSNFRRTGGLHACALFTADGEMLSLCEDVGRHNALDKLIGRELLEKRTPLSSHIVLLSGRSSFEMLQKAYTGGIAIIAAIGAPSSLAVEFARESGQTLVGFLRGKTMNVYTGAQRILAERKRGKSEIRISKSETNSK
jgi:FdhD protein